MTPCEERGLKEGQWVWCAGKEGRGYNQLANSWVRLAEDDNTEHPFFEDHTGRVEFVALSLDNGQIDFTQGIHNEKPNWTPKEYGGEGTPADPHDPEFWRDAPEGATHWDPNDNQGRPWIKHEAGRWYVWDEDEWDGPFDPNDAFFEDGNDQECIPRPALWNGEGWPPVGTVCEFSAPPAWNGWEAGTVNYIGSSFAIVKSEHGDELAFHVEMIRFRPIRTERERVIDDAHDVVIKVIGEQYGSVAEILDAAYDAGFLRNPKESDNG